MKLRILNDSIRLRLDRGEVARIAEGAAVHSHARFPSDMFLGYGLEPAEVDTITCSFIDNVITVRIPSAAATNWATTEQVSLIGEQPIDKGTLSLLIEKDFECLEPRPGEQDSDAFPNPKAR